MYRNYKITPINDFSGGLLTKIKELNTMPANTTPDSMDTYADFDKALRKRKGATKLNSVQAPPAEGWGDGGWGDLWAGDDNRCNGLFDFEGTLVSCFGGTYLYMNELDGTFTAMQTGMKNEIIQCENYESNLIICNWGQDLAKKMHLGDTSMTNLDSTTAFGQGKYPKVYKDHVLMSGAPTYPYTFGYTKVTTLADFTGGGTWPINTFDGDELTGWGELWNRLYAFKRWSIHQLTYRGGNPYWQRVQITWGVGTRSPKTIKNVTLPTGAEMLLFLGSDRKIYQFDGYSAVAVSRAIEESNGISPIALDTLNQGGLEFCHATVDTINHWYVLFVPNGGATNMTHGIVYNYYTGACWAFSNQAYRASCEALDPSGRKWIITGGYNGYAFRWNYGNTDDGTAISAYHTTPRLLMMKDSAVDTPEVVVSLRTRSDDTVNFYHREDYRTPWSTAYAMKLGNPSSEYYLGVDSVLGAMTLGPFKPVVEYPYGLDTMGEYIQFKISDSGLVTDPWVLHAYSFKGMFLGQFKQES